MAIKRKDEFRDGDYPKQLTRYPDLGNIPDDLIEMVALEFIVQATCQNCGHEGYYVDPEMANQPECKGANCSEQILLD